MTRLLLATSLAVAAGCSNADDNGTTMSQRQDAALKDPFSYNPDLPGAKSNPATTQPNKRDETLKGEWERFWNP